jgi:hypothetical protein
MTIITVDHEYSGLSDYWGGNGDRWDNNAGCLFAYYGAETTLRDCVDGWVNDFCAGGDCDSFHEDITSDDIHNAIMLSMTERARAGYKSGAIAECADAYAQINGLGAYSEDGEDDEEDLYEGLDESPVWIIKVSYTACSECAKPDEHYVDDLCLDCTKKHYPGHFDEDGEYIN